MRYKRAALGLLLVLCFALSACDSANKAVEVADSATETVQAGLDTSRFLRIVDGNPDTVDPQCTSGYYNVALNVFDRLVEVRVDADGNSTIAHSGEVTLVIQHLAEIVKEFPSVQGIGHINDRNVILLFQVKRQVTVAVGHKNVVLFHVGASFRIIV